MSLRIRIVLLLGVMLAIAGCTGGNTGNTDTSSPTTAATSGVKSVPTFSFSQPTDLPQIATAGATQAVRAVSTAESEAFVLDPQAVERGKGRYEALECASCHASDTDPAGGLIGYSASQEEFVTFMRSGGELGVDHQYAANRLSDSGAANLYHYLRSLQGQ